jgi:4,5-DOPA dioxygenase extradiol
MLMADLMPTIFFGHGNPMNTLERDVYTSGWAAIGRTIPRPKAVLCISAHWYIPETSVTAMSSPRTIHDFGGFPPELYEITYPAAGDPALASRVEELLAPMPVSRDQAWGLDHGTWCVLRHVFPDADIPVVQLSIDQRQPPLFHYETGKLLTPLRDESILLVGSGNLVHNLYAYQWDGRHAEPFDWVSRFEEKARGLLQEGKDDQLIDYPALGPEAKLSVPTPDHYLPLLYVLGSRRKGERVSFPVEGFDGGSMSMLSVQISRCAE